MTFPPMRSQMEIQRAHNLLWIVLSDKSLAEEIIPDEERGKLGYVLDCLCWVLHHDVDIHSDSCAANFAHILQFVQSELAEIEAKIGAGPPFLEGD